MRSIPTLLLRTTLFTAAVGLGWMLRGAPRPEAPPPAPAHPAPAAATLHQDTALIAISDDGRATLRVEQQPLDWVLEEIERQSGRTVARPARTTDTATASTAAQAMPAEDQCPVAAPAPRPDTARLLQAIERGTEADRFEGLLQAREDGVVLPEGLLKTVADTDASERVRLLAFEAWLEAQGDSPDGLRGALQAATLQPGTAVPGEARRRLEELRLVEQIAPDDAQMHPSP